MTEEQCDNEFRRRCERGDFDFVIAETDKEYAEGRALNTLEPNAAPSAPAAGENCAPLTGSANFNRPMTLKAIGSMIEGLSDENIEGLWEWLTAKYPPKKSNYGVRSRASEEGRIMLLTLLDGIRCRQHGHVLSYGIWKNNTEEMWRRYAGL